MSVETQATIKVLESQETRVVDPDTGGAKGSKIPQLAWAPPSSMMEMAYVYGKGAEKYSPTNYRAGYKWSLSVNAMFRHIYAWLAGESRDPETGGHHLAHAAWHCLTLMFFERRHPTFDDVRWGEEEMESLGQGVFVGPDNPGTAPAGTAKAVRKT